MLSFNNNIHTDRKGARFSLLICNFLNAQLLTWYSKWVNAKNLEIVRVVQEIIAIVTSS